MSKPPGKEELLGQRVLVYLRHLGWKCFSEVEIIWGSPTDIVAIRKRRILMIELKPTINKQLYCQMKTKSRFGHRGLHHVAMVGKVSASKYIQQWASWKWFALTDEGLSQSVWSRKQQKNKWVPAFDCMDDLGKPADLQFMSMFEGLEESDGAGSPTGSKNVSQWDLCMNLARKYPEKFKHLNYNELWHMIPCYLPFVPQSYCKDMIWKAKNTTESESETTTLFGDEQL